jgi:hypothetical protein
VDRCPLVAVAERSEGFEFAGTCKIAISWD